MQSNDINIAEGISDSIYLLQLGGGIHFVFTPLFLSIHFFKYLA